MIDEINEWKISGKGSSCDKIVDTNYSSSSIAISSSTVFSVVDKGNSFQIDMAMFQRWNEDVEKYNSSNNGEEVDEG